MSLEESRLRLMPMMKLLDGDDNYPTQNNGNGGIHVNYSDGKIVHEFSECIERTFRSVDMLMVRLADSGLVPLDTRNNNQGEDNVYLLMASNCIFKTSEFVGHHCLTLLEADSLDGPGPLDDRSSISGEDGVEIQPRMARLAELAARVSHIHASLVPLENEQKDEEEDEDTITPSTIIEAYSQYQRRCLRTRSKPAISSVAELRRVASSQNCFLSDLLDAERKRQHLQVSLDEDGDDHEDGNGMDGTTAISRGQPHAEAITVVLGEASSLIQPLAAWRDALSPQSENDNGICIQLQQLCQESMEILNKEAQTLAATVGSWFGTDQRGVATLDHDSANSKDATKSDLLSIESSLEEMAFLCQVISRYCLFSEQTLANNEDNGGTKTDSKLQDLLTEQSLHYSTLETRLATLQFNQALSLASPQLIELGRPLLKVPSIVEDAHFVCVRAIERAAGTRSERAVWTVGHWVCEVWGIDQTSGMMGGDGGVKGVYPALMQGVGCSGIDSEEDENNNDTSETRGDAMGPPSKVENAFAAALLEAADEAGQGDEKGGSNPGSAPNSAPLSGGLSSFFRIGEQGTGLQSRIDAELCALNGISAAETACTALSRLFADLVEEQIQQESTSAGTGNAPPKAASMLTFARDELASHSRSYHKLLQQRARALVAHLCGGDDLFDCDGRLCLQNLRLFIEKEVYNLDSSSFRSLEGEDRLDAEMIGPVRRSQIFEEISEDKCDAGVILQIAEAMSWKSAEIILQVLLQGKSNFNEWGALLLSKEVRMLQNSYCGLVLGSAEHYSTKSANTGSSTSTASILIQFERVNQAVSILQLEKPSDWLSFSYKVGESNETNLTADEIQKIMSLRVDFSEEAIARVCIQIGGS